MADIPRRGKKKYTNISVTGLFKTKIRNLAVGTCSGKYLDAFIAKIKEAKAQKKGITFFLWKNQPDEENPDRAPFNLTADVEQDRQDRPTRSKPIEADPFDDFPGPDNDPFTDD